MAITFFSVAIPWLVPIRILHDVLKRESIPEAVPTSRNGAG